MNIAKINVFRAVFTILCALLCGYWLLSTAVSAGNDPEWKPISPAEMALKESSIEKDADAEAIFWEVRVDDSASDELALNHYIRVKIFTERGREKFSKIDIPFIKGQKIKDIAARVVKSDNSIIELKKEDVLERDIIKADGVKIKAKSFAIAGVEPGAIVEYRYREITPGGAASNMHLIFQRDIPMQNVTYYLRPAANTKMLSFNLNDTKFEKDKNGFYRATMTNVPSFKEEPRMPPEDEVRSWMLIYYVRDLKIDTDKYWANAGGVLAYAYDIKDTLKPSGDLKKAAADIIGGASSDQEKVEKLFEFCKTQIKNITYDASLTDEDRDKIKPTKSTGETYKKKQGTLGEINELFASLAVAAGFEARITFAGDRTEIYFSPRYAHSSFVHPAGIAVKVDSAWQFYAPGSLFARSKSLPWYYENESAFLLGYKDYITTETSSLKPEESLEKRTAKFKLLEDGTLEGNVTIEYTGHLGFQRKINNYDDSPNKREESLKEEIKQRLPAVELSSINIENVTDPSKPFVYSFKVRVPNYAQKTGKRLFFQPNFFESGVKPIFTASTRKYPIDFGYAWAENDDVSIELPAGYALDNPEAPASLSDPQKIASDAVKIAVSKDGRLLTYQRRFFFGGGNNLLFPVNAYPALKNFFETFNKIDTYGLVLKQSAAATTAGTTKTN